MHAFRFPAATLAGAWWNAIAVSFAREGARGVAIVDINPVTLADGQKIVESIGTKVRTHSY